MAVAAAAAAATFGLTGVASGASLNYAALGDSYAAGVGAGGTAVDASDPNKCLRNTNAYPELYAKANSATLDFQACSGATTATVLKDQLGKLSSSTNLVSITVGGNDVEFTDVVTQCVEGSLTGGTDADCKKAVDKGEDIARNSLPGLLDNLYSQIKSKAPKAHVVVLGYPALYALGNPSCPFAPSDTSRGYLNEGAGVLDGVIQAAAKKAGFTYADVRSSFVGHQVCSGSDWIHGVELPDITPSFHPNAAGQQNGYLPNLQANAKIFYKSVRPSHS
ncbi:SGNH/GDSL hydrolase family protein [Amycolatopsis pigmentata]|uniref:SGNH/GDSL hydrolase family protein n=1 Tax=Amycolatopsis pigmentata TaxID=450801 RepID=A0ABW5FXF5_9PSEU